MYRKGEKYYKNFRGKRGGCFPVLHFPIGADPRDPKGEKEIGRPFICERVKLRACKHTRTHGRKGERGERERETAPPFGVRYWKQQFLNGWGGREDGGVSNFLQK